MKLFPLFSCLSLGVCGLSACAPLHADNTLIEAEANPTAGDLQIIDDAEASGGKSVSMPRAWQPIFKATPPAGDAFTVWVRYKTGSILLKSATAAGQKDLKWMYDKPAGLTWKKAGRFTREQIGEQLLIIRGGGDVSPVLDAVVFATDDTYQPGNVVAAAAPNSPTNTTGADEAAKAANLTEGAALALGMINAPKGTLIEAEANKPSGTNEIVTLTGASGGQAVTSGMAWQVLFQAPLPGGDAWKLYVRHKGGPFTIKTKDGDRWFWGAPDNWKWTETDVFSREDLGGKQLSIGRGNSGNLVMDAVVLAPEKKRPLPPDAPDPKKPAQQISASVDWGKTVGTVSPMLWGINEHEVTYPDRAADPEFQKLLGELKSPLIRIHHAGLINDWTDAKTRDWNVARIKAGLENSTGFGDAKIMLCVDEWPEWLSKSNALEPEKFDEFAALMGRLVRVMRDEVKRPVAYWEITNERDNSFEKVGRLEDLFKLYNKAAAAMRKEDPNAKLGGLAFTWAKPAWVNGFLQNCPDVQFISWHNYGTGDHYESNESLLAKVDSNIGNLAKGVLEAVSKHGNGRKIETFLTETNVKYTWDPYERRHQNQVGSLFHAAVVMKMADLGVTGANLWQQKGNAYGSLIAGRNETYPSYYLYQWGLRYLSGQRAAARSGDESLLQLFPVIRTDGKKALLLLNKSDHSLVLPAARQLLPGVKTGESLSSGRAHNANLTLASDKLELPGYSLTLLRE